MIYCLRQRKASFGTHLHISLYNFIGSINYIAVTVGAIFSGFIAEWLGRRVTIRILTLSYIAAWTTLYYAKGITMLFVALTLSGLIGGLAESPLQTYAAEISEPSLRGGLSTTISMTLTIGVFLQFLIGSYVYWRTLVLINLIFPVACFLVMCFIPESPHWLASKTCSIAYVHVFWYRIDWN